MGMRSPVSRVAGRARGMKKAGRLAPTDPSFICVIPAKAGISGGLA